MQYLFLAVPTYSGSTALHNFIAECKNVASLKIPQGIDFQSPEYENMPSITEGALVSAASGEYTAVPLDTRVKMVCAGAYANELSNCTNWNKVKEIWDLNWDLSGQKSVRLQKTPYDVYQVKAIQNVFKNAKWIIMVREPYSWAYSSMQRLAVYSINPNPLIELIVKHIVETYKIQKENKNFLLDNCYTMKLEEWYANSSYHEENIKKWMPELSDLSFSKRIKVKGEITNNVTLNNNSHIEKLGRSPGALRNLTRFFEPYEQIITDWGYKLL